MSAKNTDKAIRTDVTSDDLKLGEDRLTVNGDPGSSPELLSALRERKCYARKFENDHILVARERTLEPTLALPITRKVNTSRRPFTAEYTIVLPA